MTVVSPKLGSRVALHRFERTQTGERAGSSETVISNGLAMRRFGPDNGRRALLVHGWNADGQMMAPLARALASRGYSVMLPDLPGEGANPPAKWNFVEKAERLASHLRSNPHFDVIAAHSAGGLIAAMALEFGLKADAFVTICGHYSMATLLQAYLRRSQAPDRLQPAILETFKTRTGRDAQEIGPSAYRQLEHRQLVVHARSDWQVRLDEAYRIASVNPAASVLELPGCSHQTVLSHPDLAKAIVRFVESNLLLERAS